MPKLYNKHHRNYPAGAVYIGRPGPWGNPFSHQAGKDVIAVASRDEAVNRFEALVEATPGAKEMIRQELRGKDLVCWCAPLRCHGDVLLRIANEEEPS